MARVTDAHIEARRQDILDAAARVFATAGFAKATMAEIAAKAGISAGAIYRYFPSKQELAAACFLEGAQQMAAEWAFQFEHADDPFTAFIDVAERSFEELGDEGAGQRTRIMLESYLEATRAKDEELVRCCDERDAIVAGLGQGIDLMKQAGELPADTDTAALAGAFWSFWLGARVTRLLDPEADTDAQLAALQGLIEAIRPKA